MYHEPSNRAKLSQNRKSRVKRTIRTEVTIETDERLIIRRGGQLPRARCSECGEQGTMISLEEAVALAGVSSRAIHHWVETGQIHFAETSDGFLLVCLNALLLRLAGRRSDNRLMKLFLRSHFFR